MKLDELWWWLGERQYLKIKGDVWRYNEKNQEKKRADSIRDIKRKLKKNNKIGFL